MAQRPEFKYYAESDRDNNAVTRNCTGGGQARVQGIAIYVNELRSDGSGIAFALNGYSKRKEFRAPTWQQAYDKANEWRNLQLHGTPQVNSADGAQA